MDFVFDFSSIARAVNGGVDGTPTEVESNGQNAHETAPDETDMDREAHNKGVVDGQEKPQRSASETETDDMGDDGARAARVDPWAVTEALVDSAASLRSIIAYDPDPANPKRYSEDQPRDTDGKWSAGGSGEQSKAQAVKALAAKAGMGELSLVPNSFIDAHLAAHPGASMNDIAAAWKDAPLDPAVVAQMQQEDEANGSKATDMAKGGPIAKDFNEHYDATKSAMDNASAAKGLTRDTPPIAFAQALYEQRMQLKEDVRHAGSLADRRALIQAQQDKLQTAIDSFRSNGTKAGEATVFTGNDAWHMLALHGEMSITSGAQASTGHFLDTAKTALNEADPVVARGPGNGLLMGRVAGLEFYGAKDTAWGTDSVKSVSDALKGVGKSSLASDVILLPALSNTYGATIYNSMTGKAEAHIISASTFLPKGEGAPPLSQPGNTALALAAQTSAPKRAMRAKWYESLGEDLSDLRDESDRDERDEADLDIFEQVIGEDFMDRDLTPSPVTIALYEKAKTECLGSTTGERADAVQARALSEKLAESMLDLKFGGKRFNPDEPRDKNGEWGSDGGGETSAKGAVKNAGAASTQAEKDTKHAALADHEGSSADEVAAHQQAALSHAAAANANAIAAKAVSEHGKAGLFGMFGHGADYYKTEAENHLGMAKAHQNKAAAIAHSIKANQEFHQALAAKGYGSVSEALAGTGGIGGFSPATLGQSKPFHSANLQAARYSEDEPRDPKGEWSSGGGDASSHEEKQMAAVGRLAKATFAAKATAAAAKAPFKAALHEKASQKHIAAAEAMDDMAMANAHMLVAQAHDAMAEQAKEGQLVTSMPGYASALGKQADEASDKAKSNNDHLNAGDAHLYAAKENAKLYAQSGKPGYLAETVKHYKAMLSEKKDRS